MVAFGHESTAGEVGDTTLASESLAGFPARDRPKHDHAVLFEASEKVTRSIAAGIGAT
jgi:hypothetical protein